MLQEPRDTPDFLPFFQRIYLKGFLHAPRTLTSLHLPLSYILPPLHCVPGPLLAPTPP